MLDATQQLINQENISHFVGKTHFLPFACLVMLAVMHVIKGVIDTGLQISIR